MSLEKVIDDKITDLLMKIDKQKLPKHVAIIMDGNGRWATRKGLPRSFGHKQGVSVLKKILKAAKNLGCKVITVYAFSTENWTRPTKEVDFLINLFSEVLKNEIKEIHEESTKIKFIGDLTPFPKNLKEIISNSESLTKNNNKFLFNVCVNYGGRQEIVKVAKKLALKSSAGEIKPNEIKEIHRDKTKIKFIGDLTPFPESLKKIISSSESLTKNNNEFLLLSLIHI